MTVKELIEALEEVENKELPVYVYHTDCEIYEIYTVDDFLNDRVDLNTKEF